MHDSLAFDLNDVHVPRGSGRPAARTSNPLGLLLVCPFTIVVDTREQLPYTFSGMTGSSGEILNVPTVRAGLESGDYSIQGLEDRVAIERKSLEDCYGSVTWERDRFSREIERLNDLAAGGFAAVVIEADWREILDPAEHRPGWINQTEPRSVVGTIDSWSIRYPRVHWIPAGDRRGGECRTFSLLRRFWQERAG